MATPRKRAPRRGRALSFSLCRSALTGACLLALTAPVLAMDGSDKTGKEKRDPTSVQQSMALAPHLSLPPLPLRKPATPQGFVTKVRATATSGLPGVAESAALRYGVDPHLVHAVILTESHYRPDALSHKGAMGLMQLIPSTARILGVDDPWDPHQNIDGGVRHLRDLLRHFRDTELALAAYNAGKRAVERYGNTVPPYKETQTYVARAFGYMDKLKNGASIDKLRRTGAGVSTRLSGWGVIFGSFYKQDQARSVIKRNRKIIGSNLRGGRSVVLKRQFAGLGPYNAMIVGLKQEGASAACRSIRQTGGYCLAIPPKQLTDKRAIWR